jgi:phosphoacetylglucosamine mutase
LKDFIETMETIIKNENININEKAFCYIGYDTRPSSPKLVQSLKEGILSINGEYKDFGLLTTPILHYMINYDNINKKTSENENIYYEALSNSFKNVVKNNIKKEIDCIVDCGILFTKISIWSSWCYIREI